MRDKENKAEELNNQYDPDNQKNENNNKGLFDWIYKLFISSDSLLLLFGLFIVFYFCLQKMRQRFGNRDKYNNNTTSNKKTNKNNKSNKKEKIQIYIIYALYAYDYILILFFYLMKYILYILYI